MVLSVSHAVRRHGRLSHGRYGDRRCRREASSAGPGNAALASHRAMPVINAIVCGCLSPCRYRFLDSRAGGCEGAC